MVPNMMGTYGDWVNQVWKEIECDNYGFLHLSKQMQATEGALRPMRTPHSFQQGLCLQNRGGSQNVELFCT